MMLESLVGRCTVLFMISICVAVAIQMSENEQTKSNYAVRSSKNEVPSDDAELQRSKRLLFKKPAKPGIIRLTGQLAYQQINETASAYRQISTMIRENFADSNEPAPVPENLDPNVTTTPAPFRITREDFFALIRRNLRGLVRLFQIEIKDALNQSSYSISDYRKEFHNELGRIIG